jgi:hypothetical protein
MASSHSGVTLLEFIVNAFLVLMIAAIALPRLQSRGQVRNPRSAATSLRTLASAEAGFRANDRDWNRVCDFWNADLRALSTITIPAALVRDGIPSLGRFWSVQP